MNEFRQSYSMETIAIDALDIFTDKNKDVLIIRQDVFRDKNAWIAYCQYEGKIQ